MSFTPKWAISLVNRHTDHGLIDIGASDLKTAKGAMKNWVNNFTWAGSPAGNFIRDSSLLDIEILARPVNHPLEVVPLVLYHNAQRYAEREFLTHGAQPARLIDFIPNYWEREVTDQEVAELEQRRVERAKRMENWREDPDVLWSVV
jgi:hypothetical protein